MSDLVTRSQSRLNMIEVAKRFKKDGTLFDVAEILTETNPLIADALWVESSDMHVNKVARRAKLPESVWAQYYKGTPPDASQTEIFTFPLGRLKARSEIDADLAEDSPDRDGLRRTESYAHIEGMGQKLSRTVMYGNSDAEAGSFNGFAYHLDSLALNNVVSAGTPSDAAAYKYSSIYLIKWSPMGVYLHYPKNRPNGNAPFGIEHKSLPKEKTYDRDGNPYYIYPDEFMVHAGVTIKDPRYMARVCNIDLERLQSDPDYRIAIRWLIQATQRTPNRGVGVIAYMSPEVHTEFIVNAIEDSHYWTSNLPDVYGYYFERAYQFRLRSLDCITNNEAAVV